jgi:hypothetical protein
MALAVALLAAASCASIARASSSCGLALPPTATPLGSLAARPARFSPPSRWSVGGETLDRGFTNFSAWSPFLGPLGATAVRMQAGWARCEPRGNGAYEWAWLDAAVDGALAAGVEPWLQLSFGNAAYVGGGTASVGSPLPEGATALAAWSAWTRAAVARYAPRLARGAGTWEVWNEPNIQHISATAYADFALLTAEVVRAVAPLATVRVGVLAGTDAPYAAAFAARVAQTPGGGALFDEFTYHPYDYNPDESYAGVATLRAALDAGGLAHVSLVQGESGAPSVGGGYGALTAYNWTECSQAKWFARRLLGDGARGIPSSAFSIIDLCYNDAVNHKGLVSANCSAAGLPALGTKTAYAAVQHVFGAVDGSFAPAAGLRVNVDAACGAGAVVFAGAWTTPLGEIVFALWNASGTPLDAVSATTATCDVNLTLSAPRPPPSGAGSFAGVDVMTGAAFAVAGGLVEGGSGGGGGGGDGGAALVFAFRALPVSDTPLLLAPPAALRLVPPPPAAGALPRAADVAALVEPLLDAFEAAHASGDAHWERAAFFFGLSSALALPLARDHAPYALAWAAANNYSCGGSQWPGDLGLAWTADVLVARGLAPPSARAPLAAVMAAEAASAPRYLWSWVDTLAFNLPEWLAFGAALAQPEWTSFAAAQFRDTRDGLTGNASAPGLWSAAHSLWWRDAAARAAVSPNGAPVFWARGNGWAALAIVRALELHVLAEGDALRAELEATLVAMAAALAPLQGADGLWRASLLDADAVPNAEASGSGAFLALFAFGVRAGLLPRAVYAPVIARAWAGLATMLVAPDASRVGFCQPVGAAPAPATAADTSDFCLGLVVAGAAQVWALVDGPAPALPPSPSIAASPAPAPAPFSLGVGTNLGNTLEAPFEGQWAPAAQEAFFDDFKSAKFATVRIPVRWDNHTLREPPFTVNATWMARVKTVVSWCTARGFSCIINSHWDSWLDTNSSAAFDAALPRFSAIWAQVAAAFVGAPASLLFESFNEPHLVDTPKLNALLAAFYAAVRPLHPTRRLILGWLNFMGPSWIEEDHEANWDAMLLPTLPGGAPDPNLAVETHSYDPYDVCGRPTRPWNSEPSDIPNMDFMFATLANWSATHSNTPVFMGESGCIRKQSQTSRVAWYRAFFERVQAAPGLAGGLVWDDDGQFCIYNRSTRAFDVEVLRAIGL